MTHDEMIKVIQAHKEGRRIEFKSNVKDMGWEACRAPQWNFMGFDYRIDRGPRKLWIKWSSRPNFWTQAIETTKPDDTTGWQEVTEQL